MVNVALDHPVERYGIFIYFATATADKAVTVSAQSNGAFGNEQSIIKKILSGCKHGVVVGHKRIRADYANRAPCISLIDRYDLYRIFICEFEHFGRNGLAVAYQLISD